MKTIEELKSALLKKYEQKCKNEKEAIQQDGNTRELISFGGGLALENFGFWELNIKEEEFESIRAKYFPNENQ